LKQCYQIVHDFLKSENPDFDQERMEVNLDTIFTQVQKLNMSYGRFKGEFFAVNEPLINKDMLTFKLERVERYKQK